MRLILALFFAVLTVFQVNAQGLLVNEYYNASTGGDEWLEFVVTENLNLQDWSFRDFTGSGSTTTAVEFTDDALWADVPAGTILLITGEDITTPAEDIDPSDGVLVVNISNTTYFTGGSFSIAGGSDAVQTLDGTGTHVHMLSHGSDNSGSAGGAFSGHNSGSLSSGESLGFTGTTELADFGVDGNTSVVSNPTPGAANDVDNEFFINGLRGETSDADIRVISDGSALSSGATVSFGSIVFQNSSSQTLRITNNGGADLEITRVGLETRSHFGLEGSYSNTTLARGEDLMVQINYVPQALGSHSDVLSIESNDPDMGSFTLNLSGRAIEEGGPIAIADARQAAIGETVTIAGRITAAEFMPPFYMQDATGGMAIYDPDFDNVAVGDSVVLTGEIDEFNNLLEVVSLTDFNKISTESRVPEPREVTISEVDESIEAQLIIIRDVQFEESGSFSTTSSNYTITDNTGSMQLRVEDATNIGNAPIPTGTINVVGVIGQYRDNYQLLPRTVEDIGTEIEEIPGSDVPFDETFEVVTWNVEWFSSPDNGPSDDAQQEANVREVIIKTDADLYAFQEISDETAFLEIFAGLQNYRAFVAPIDQTQKLAFAYKTDIIDSVEAGFLNRDWEESQTNFNPFAGRDPYHFVFNVTVEGTTVENVHAVTIHAKAQGERQDYLRRQDDSEQLKAYLDANHTDDNVIILGDMNDQLTANIYNGGESPYQNFLDDSLNYRFLSKSLEERGLFSYPFSGGSMLDHVMITDELFNIYFEGTTQLVNTSYIGSYLSSTSDHYPVLSRFDLDLPTSAEDDLLADQLRPEKVSLSQNYPNPFNPSTTISFTLDETQEVSLKVYDLMGREVAELHNGQISAGSHTATFDASGLASGVYIYQLQTETSVLNRKMTLIK